MPAVSQPILYAIFVVSLNLFVSCGPTTTSSQGRSETMGTEMEGNKKITELDHSAFSSSSTRYEIILPVDTLKGMSDSERINEAFGWWVEKDKILWVRFRLGLAPYSRDRLLTKLSALNDYRNRLEEHKKAAGLDGRQPYYLLAAASDFYREVCPVKEGKCQCSAAELAEFSKNPEKMYLNPLIARELLKDPNVKGLYIHELMAFSNNKVPNDNPFNCPKTDVVPVLWNKLIAYAKAAKEEKKQIIWNDAGDEGAWKWLQDALAGAPGTTWRDREGAKKLFSEYGAVIVPLWANNRATGDRDENDYCPVASTNGVRVYCDKINNSIVSLKAISNEYTRSRFGASIQDWHTYATFDPSSYSKKSESDCIKRDVLNYAARAQNENSQVFEFESYWSGDKFFEALTEIKNALLNNKKIVAGSWSDPVCLQKAPVVGKS